MVLRDILFVLLIVEITIVILLKFRRKMTSKGGARETNLRLTYKRYREIYPNSTISYPEYKKLQARKAYKKAVSAMKLERMVR